MLTEKVAVMRWEGEQEGKVSFADRVTCSDQLDYSDIAVLAVEEAMQHAEDHFELVSIFEESANGWRELLKGGDLLTNPKILNVSDVYGSVATFEVESASDEEVKTAFSELFSCDESDVTIYQSNEVKLT